MVETAAAAPEEIMVCNQHETPLIWTFKFPYSEYFCMTGNHHGGMLGTGHNVPATPELIELQATERALWDEISKDIALGQFWRKDCPKCNAAGGEYHLKHITEDEKRRSDEALKKLEAYANGR